MQKVAQEYVKNVTNTPNIHQSGGVLNPLSSPWPFAQWGLDIVGHFPKEVGIRDGCWSVRITSPSGLNLNYWQILGTWMSRDLFGKILSLSLGSPIPSS